MFSYLFEAKSIQSYLFGSGKLKDVIAASERLDRLIDSSTTSTLFQVLASANITNDLLAPSPHVTVTDSVYFLRCKGGAFYAYSLNAEPLQKLRSLWTLTLTQLFPSLVYTDALSEANTLSEAMALGHNMLAANRNAPQIQLPTAKTIIQRYQRTGRAAVPVSSDANKATHHDDSDELDLDTEHHRQAYQILAMRDSAALQDKFTPLKLKGNICYPINFDEQFEFEAVNVNLTRTGKDAVKDMALIHIDGNGIGLILLALKSTLQHEEHDTYRQGFRAFSDAISKATIAAAQTATANLYERIVAEGSVKNNKGKIQLPMRPIVLGGDDITLFCRADLALKYAQLFCNEFKKESELVLSPLFKTYFKKSSLQPYLTASGGVLYHKASHPFTHSHQLVEALCDKAKVLTKSVYPEKQQVGPAALAIYRASNASQNNINNLIEQTLTVKTTDVKLTIGQLAYFTEAENSLSAFINQRNFRLLEKIIALSSQDSTPVSLSKWRQMATHIAMGDISEANRIFYRSQDLYHDKLKVKELDTLLSQIQQGDSKDPWYWQTNNENPNELTSFINDLLVLSHYQPAAISAQKEVI
jgi:hypothetical protein